MVIDFGIIKVKLGGWIDEILDHTTMFQKGDLVMETMSEHCAQHDMKPWVPMLNAPTAENIAQLLLDRGNILLATFGVTVVHVRVWETPNCYADAGTLA